MLNQNFKQKRQSGVVLVVCLVMLLLLTLIGVTAMQTTGLEERMAGNMRDRNIAFQAAEAALRDAELDIKNLNINNQKAQVSPRISGFSDFTGNCGKSTTADTSDDGLCYAALGAAYTANINDKALENPNGTKLSMVAAPSVQYGTFTAAGTLPGNLSSQPRYMIEGLRGNPGTDCDRSTAEFCYRITVRAQGVNDQTVVWLQTVFKPQ